MVMGKARILELVLKNLLACRYSHDREQMEKGVLGQTEKMLDRFGVCSGFIKLIGSVAVAGPYCT